MKMLKNQRFQKFFIFLAGIFSLGLFSSFVSAQISIPLSFDNAIEYIKRIIITDSGGNSGNVLLDVDGSNKTIRINTGYIANGSGWNNKALGLSGDGQLIYIDQAESNNNDYFPLSGNSIENPITGSFFMGDNTSSYNISMEEFSLNIMEGIVRTGYGPIISPVSYISGIGTFPIIRNRGLNFFLGEPGKDISMYLSNSDATFSTMLSQKKNEPMFIVTVNSGNTSSNTAKFAFRGDGRLQTKDDISSVIYDDNDFITKKYVDNRLSSIPGAIELDPVWSAVSGNYIPLIGTDFDTNPIVGNLSFIDGPSISWGEQETDDTLSIHGNKNGLDKLRINYEKMLEHKIIRNEITFFGTGGIGFLYESGYYGFDTGKVLFLNHNGLNYSSDYSTSFNNLSIPHIGYIDNNFIPYIGATKNINLGNNNLTVSGATSLNGTTVYDKLTLNSSTTNPITLQDVAIPALGGALTYPLLSLNTTVPAGGFNINGFIGSINQDPVWGLMGVNVPSKKSANLYSIKSDGQDSVSRLSVMHKNFTTMEEASILEAGVEVKDDNTTNSYFYVEDRGNIIDDKIIHQLGVDKVFFSTTNSANNTYIERFKINGGVDVATASFKNTNVDIDGNLNFNNEIDMPFRFAYSGGLMEGQYYIGGIRVTATVYNLP